MRRSLLTVAAALGSVAVTLGLATPASAASTTVCTGVEGCRVVASGDIDGDGRADQVGIVAKNITSSADGTITVRVRTASNKVLQTTGSDVSWPVGPFHGLAAIDGVPGKEIIVGDFTGAHALQWRVVTYRKGRLVTLPPPPHSSLTRSSRWATDGSYSVQLGWSRHVSKTGVVYLKKKEALRKESGHGHVGKTTVYRWKSGKWVKTSTRKVRYKTDKAAFKIGGWHLRGLAVWPK